MLNKDNSPGIPEDCVPLMDLAREIAAHEGVDLGRTYRRLRSWVDRGKVGSYKRRSGGLTLVSRAEVDAMRDIIPRPTHNPTERRDIGKP